MQSAPELFLRWSLTSLVSLVLILQSAGASLALCKLGVEESGCCGAHSIVAPSCCSAEGERSSEEPGAESGDCSCELFGELPTCSLTSSTDSTGSLLEHGYAVSASVARVGETPASELTRATPPRGSPPPELPKSLLEELMSWRL